MFLLVAFDKQKLLCLSQIFRINLAFVDQLGPYIRSVIFFQLHEIISVAKKMVDKRVHLSFNHVYLLITLTLLLPVAQFQLLSGKVILAHDYIYTHKRYYYLIYTWGGV